jgi:hypothetical protein
LIGRHERTRLIVHHTVGVDDDETKNVVESLTEVRLRMIRLQRIRPELGLDVPYSFVAFLADLDLEGWPERVLVVCEGRGYDRSGAHTRGHNIAGIGLAMAGDFENYPYTPFDAVTVMRLLSRFAQHLKHEEGMFNLGAIRPSPSREAFGHWDLGQTSCPGILNRLNLHRLKFIEKEDEDMPDEELRQAMYVAGLFASAASSLDQGIGLPDNEADALWYLLLAAGGDQASMPTDVNRNHAAAIMRYGEARAQQRRPLSLGAIQKMLWILSNWL